MNGNKVYEKNISKAIIQNLNRMPMTKVWKRRAGPFEKGRADITGSCFGVRIEIEVKIPGKTPTDLQQKWLDEMTEKLCIAGIARSVDDAIQIVLKYFNAFKNHIGSAEVIDYVKSKS